MKKRSLKSPNSKRKLSERRWFGRKLTAELLESRRLLTGDLFFQATGSGDLLLQLSGDTLQVVDTSSTVLASKSLDEITEGVLIEGNAYDVQLTIDASVPIITGGIQFIGGTGTNTLIGPDADTDWILDGSGSGSFGSGNRFNGVEWIVGGTSDDNFVFESDGSIPGGINGGGGNDAVIAPSGDNNWVIDSADGGRFNGYRFDTIGNLIGGTGTDDFVFTGNGSISGTVNGGNDDASLEIPASNSLDFRSFAASVTIDLGERNASDSVGAGVIGNFTAIDSISGSAYEDTLLGPDETTVEWTIDGVNAGDVGGIGFASFENLIGVGDSASDAFTFEEGGSIGGTVDGGSGTLDSIRVFRSEEEYTVFNPAAGVDNSGILSLNGKTIQYTGIDHQDFLSDDGGFNLVIQGTAFADKIIIEDTGTSTDGLMRVRFDGVEISDGTNTTDVISFVVPADSLTIEANGGADEIEVKSLDNTFAADLLIYGHFLDEYGIPEDDVYTDSVIFSGDINTQGGFLDVWADCITVNANVKIAVGDNDIVFRSRRIGIAELENLSPVLGTSRSVAIDVGAGAELSADGGIYLIAQTEDRSLADVLGLEQEVNNFLIQPLMDKIGDLLALPVKVLVKNSSATITLQANAKVLSGGTVGIYSTAVADASGSASSSLVSIGYGRAVATATVDIQSGVEVVSQDATVITASGSATSSISSSTGRTLESTSNPSSLQIAGSIAVSDANVTSHVTVAETASITAGKTANIAASGEVTSEAEVSSGMYSDGTAAVAFGLEFSQADIHTTVNGSVTANMNPGSVVKIEIDPTVTASDDEEPVGYVDYENNMIHVGPHALVTEDVIEYTNRFGTSIGNMVDGRSYYVVALADDPTTLDRDESEWIQLAETEVQAIMACMGFEDGNVVDLIAQDGLLATAVNEAAFDGTDINPATNSIELRDEANGDFNKFELGQAVVYHEGTEIIPGLVDGGTYYIIVSLVENDLDGDSRFADSQMVQLAESENEARAGVAIDIGASDGTGFTFAAKHVLDSGFSTGIGITSRLTAEDKAAASSGLQSEDATSSKWEKFNGALETNVVDTIFSKLTESYAANASKANSGASSSLSVAGALAFSFADHSVLTDVGETAALKSNEDLEVTATIEESYQINSESTFEPQENADGDSAGTSAENAVSVAVNVGIYDNTAIATVHGGAKLDGLRATRVISDVTYPFLTELDTYAPTSLGEFVDRVRTDGASAVTQYLDTTLGTKDAFFNSWTLSTASSDQLAIAGSVNVLILTNESDAIVESGVKINQDAAWHDNAQNPHANQAGQQADLLGEEVVTVMATNYMQTINMTGIFSLPDLSIDPTDKSKTSLTLPSAFGSDSEGRGGMGGACFITVQNNTTHAIVEDEVKIYSGGDGGFNIKAAEAIFEINLTQAGASAGKLAIGGSVAYVGVTNDTLAQLGSETIVTGRDVRISATDFESQINWVGGVAKGENVGVGIAVAINQLDRKTRSVIGDPDILESSGEAIATTTFIDVTDNVSVQSIVDGELWAFAVAGAAVTGSEPDTGNSGSVFQDDDPLDGQSLPALFGENVAPEQTQTKTGIGIAAAVSVNLLWDDTLASIVDAGTIIAEGVSVIAESNQSYVTATGGVAFAKGGPTSQSANALAGALSFNNLDVDTRALLLDTEVVSNRLTVDAKRAGNLIAISAGAAGTTSGKGATIAGSVSVNRLINTTEAYLAGVEVDVAGNGEISALDTSEIIAIGGGMAIGSAVGIGFSIGFNEIASDTRASIENSNLDVGGELSLTAINDNALRSVGVSAGVSKDIGVAFTIGVNLIHNTDTAEILNSTVTGASSVALLAQDDSVLQAIGGALGVGMKKAGVGGALGWNSVTNTTTARIEDSTLCEILGPISVIAISSEEDPLVDGKITSLAVGAAGSKDVAIGGALSINVIMNTVDAHISDSSITNTGDLTISGTDTSSIDALAFGGAEAGGVAGGIAISTNVITNTISSEISGSTVTSGEDVSVTSESSEIIRALAIGVTHSSSTAVSISALGNGIANDITASILDSTVTAGGNIEVAALDVAPSVIPAWILTDEQQALLDESLEDSSVDLDANILAVMISVAGSGSTAVSGSLSGNVITNTVQASIVRSTVLVGVDANGIIVDPNADLILTSLSENGILAITVGVGTAGSVAVSATGFGNVITNSVESVISGGSTVMTTGEVDLSALDHSSIQSIGLSIAASGTVSVAVIVGANVVINTVVAEIVGSTVSCDETLSIVATNESGIFGASGGVAASNSIAGQATLAANVITNTTRAGIVEEVLKDTGGNILATVASTVVVGGAASILATDDSTIKAISGAVAVASGVSVGAASSTNIISNTTTATVNGATLICGAAVEALASGTSSIQALAAGLSASAESAVAGSLSQNMTSSVIEAIVSDADIQAAGRIEIAAEDSATIESFSGIIAIGLNSYAIGGAAAYNEISDTVRAHALSATLSSSGSDILVTANGDGSIESLAVAGSGGGMVGVAGSIAVANIGNTIDALVSDSTLSADGSILIQAVWDGLIQSYGGTGAVGGVVGVGGTLVLNNLTNHVQAILRNSQATAAGNGDGISVARWAKAANANGWQDDRLSTLPETIHGLAVIADSSETMDNAFATLGLTLGLGLNVNKSVNVIGDVTTASIGDTTGGYGTIEAPSVVVRASHDTAVTNLGGVAQGAGVGLVGAIDTTIIDAQTTATILGHGASRSTSVIASGKVDVSAWSQDIVNSQTGSAAANALGAAGAVSAVEITSNTRAYIDHVQLNTNGDLTVMATRIADVVTKAGAINISLLAGVGGSVDYVTIGGTTEASISASTIEVAGDTSILATSHTRIQGKSGTAGVGGIAAVVGAASVHLIETVTQADLKGSRVNQATTQPGQDLTIQAMDHAEIKGNAGSVAGSLVAGVGGSMDVGVIRNSSLAQIGAGVMISVGGDVNVDAQATQHVDSYAKGYAIGLLAGLGGSVSAIGLGGGLSDDVYHEANKFRDAINDLLYLAGGIDGLASDEISTRIENTLSRHSLSVDAAITNEPETVSAVLAEIGTMTQITAGGNVYINAQNMPSATSDCGQLNAGIVAVGGTLASANVTTSVSAVIGDNVQLSADGDITIQSESQPTLTVDVETGDYSAIVGIGSAKVTIGMDISTLATIGKSAEINAGNTVDISARTILDGISATAEGTVGSLIAEGEVEVTGAAELVTQTTVGMDSQVVAEGDILMQAGSEVTDLEVQAAGGGGGLAGVGGAWAEFDFSTMDTDVLVGAFSELIAKGDVQLTASSRIDQTAFVSQDLGAVTAGASVEAEVATVMLTTVTVDDAAIVSGQNVTITAIAEEVRGHAVSDCNVKGLQATSESWTQVWYVITPTVWIDVNASVTGRDTLNLLARVNDLDAVTSNSIDGGSLAPHVDIKAYDHVAATTIVHLSGGAVLVTPILNMTSDPVYGDQVYDKDAGVISVSGLASHVDRDAPADLTYDSQIEFYGDAVHVPALSLHVDAAGNIEIKGGFTASLNEAEHEIVVDDFLFSGSVQPSATLAAVGGTIVGTGRFLSGNAPTCSLINESNYALHTGAIMATTDLVPVDWFISIAADDVSGFNYTIEEVSTENDVTHLTIDSVGDVRLGNTLSLPHGTINIQTEGSILNVATGDMSLEAWYTYLTAGGSIGTEAAPLSVSSKDETFFAIQAVAGQDVWLDAKAQISDPTATSVLLVLSDLVAGGDLNLTYVSTAHETEPGTWNTLPTTLQLSGQASAGGDFNLIHQGSGLLQIYQPITAGDNVNLEVWDGGVYLQEAITATDSVIISASQEIGAGPSQLITAHDILLQGRAVGGTGDGTLKIDLTGGLLTAAAEVDLGIREVSGPLNIRSILCSAGGVRLEVRDTAGSDDDIVLDSIATINAATQAILTAGDHLLLDETARIRAGQLTINLDTAASDPDSGIGVEWAMSTENFEPQSSTEPLEIVLNTGDDDDLLTVDETSPDQVLQIHSGAGDDRLLVGTGGLTENVYGTVLFDGGEGQDQLIFDDNADTVGRIFQLGQIFSTSLNLQGPAITQNEAEQGIWYQQVETLDVRLGNGGDILQLDATDAEVQQVLIDSGAGSDEFNVGSGPMLLSAIHGEISLLAGTGSDDSDTLLIVENNFVAGVTYADDLLTSTRFVGQGLTGIDYAGFESLQLTLNSSDNGLTITDLTTPATIDLDIGDNQLTLGTSDVPLAEAFAASLSIACGSGQNAVELFDTANTTLATWALSDTKITFAGPLVELTGSFQEITIHLGQGGAIVSSSITTSADITIEGNVGADSLNLLAAPGGQIIFDGNAGDDWLIANAIPDGSVLFHGGDGTDHVTLDGSSWTEERSVTLESAPLTISGAFATDAWIGVSGYTNGVVYDAEQLELTGGSGVEHLYVTATAATTELVKIRTGAGQDVIQIGTDGGPLDSIHGVIDVRQTEAEDNLWIYSGSTAGQTLTGLVTSTSVTGLGLEQEILINRLNRFGLFLGDANENLVICSLPELIDPLVEVNLGRGDDTLTLGGVDDNGFANLDRLAGATFGMTGGDGNDTLLLDDHQSTTIRDSLLITDVNVQNLGFDQITTTDFESLEVRLNDLGNQVTIWKMARPVTIEAGTGNDTFNIADMTAGSEWPLVIQAGAGNDQLNLGDAAEGHDTIAATIQFYGGLGNDVTTIYDLDDGACLDVYGEDGIDSFYLEYMGGGSAIFYGGRGDDELQFGQSDAYHTIAGDVSFYGQAGDDLATVYQLRSTGSLWFDGGSDNDTLNLTPTDGETSRLDYVDGQIVFQGGDGNDSFRIDASSNGGSLTLATATPTNGSESMAWANWESSAAGLYWAAENGSIVMGGVSNLVYLQATASECQTFDITATGDCEFHIEAQSEATLEAIHGQITLTAAGSDSDWLRIDSRESTVPLWALLTDTTFQVLDSTGAKQSMITYTGFEGMDVYLGDTADKLSVGSLPSYTTPVVFSLGGGDDLIELGQEQTLSLLSWIRSDVIIYGEDGYDTVAFHNDNYSLPQSVTFAGGTFDGLLPDGISAGLGTVEKIDAHLGYQNDTVTISNPTWDLYVDTGSGNDSIQINTTDAERQVQIVGGTGADKLVVGNKAGTEFPTGTVEFWGGAENDEASIYRSASTSIFYFYGEDGDDQLTAGIAPPYDITLRLMNWIDGAVCFDGGQGNDTLTMEQTIAGDVIARFHQSTAPNGNEMAHFTGLDMDQGLWYDAEYISLNMGNTYTSTNLTEVYIDATGSTTQTLEVSRFGGVPPQFHVGTDVDLPLSAIHGQLVLSGSSALLEISEAGVSDGADALTLSWAGAPVYRGELTSRWFDGISYQGFGDFLITASDAADTITVQSLQSIFVEVQLLDVQTEDLVVLGQTIGSSHQITVNGVKPIYAVPSAATSGSMAVSEGTDLSESLFVRDVLADRNPATLTTDHGSIVSESGYVWQYTVAGSLQQTVALTVTDSEGYQVQKLFDLVVTNVAPVANNDAYTVRERATVLGNVLDNDANYNNQPLVLLINDASHGTLALEADGSFSYTPNVGFIGEDTFTYKINDGLTESDVATVTIQVVANSAPVAAADTLTKRLFQSISLEELLANDVDADGDLLTIVILTQPSIGSVTLNDDDTFSYIPESWAAEYSTTFTYAVYDGLTLSEAATVTLIPESDEAPEATEDWIGTLLDTARLITTETLVANDSDPDGDTLSVIIQSQPEYGTLTYAGDGTWIYEPAAGFSGWDSFTYVATDGMKRSEPVTVWIKVAVSLPTHTLAVNSIMSTPNGSLAGTSWAYAYNLLQDALDRAEELNSDDNSENDITAIWVAGGTYTPTQQRDAGEALSASFLLTSNVTITGGFEGVESSPDERSFDDYGQPIYETILSGDVQRDNYELNNIWMVVYADNVQNTALDTLTITGAYGWDGSSFEDLDRWLGGGIYAESSTLTLSKVRITDNFACGGGAGIYQSGGSLQLENVTVENNSTWNSGGGLWLVDGDLSITNSTFNGNRSQSGGGLCLSKGNVTLINVAIGSVSGGSNGTGGNYAGEAGGGIFLEGPIDAQMTNVMLAGNQSSLGGGIYLAAATDLDVATLTVTNGVFTNNMGGAVHNAGGTLTLSNTTVAYNYPSGNGCIYSDSTATTTLLNSLIAENCNDWPESGDIQGVFSDASAANLIGIAAAGTTGLVNDVNRNMVGTPETPLASGLDDTLHLTDGSLAIGAGDSSLLPADTDDLDGDGTTTEPLPWDAEQHARVSETGLNIGAYQYSAPVADAGGPYIIDEGKASIELVGWSSFEQPALYEWDMNGWGEYTTDSTFFTDCFDGPGEYTVWLRVTNQWSVAFEDSAIVIIRNVAPEVDAGSDILDGNMGEAILFTGQFTDPGWFDTHTILWDFGDGTTQSDTLTPAHTYTAGGTYTVTLTVTDDDGGVGSDTLQVTVSAAPVASDDAYEIDEDATLTVAASGVLTNDSDNNGDPLSVELVADPSHGTLVFNSNGSFTYQPEENWFGKDVFTYRAWDGQTYSNVATVVLTVNPINDAPVAYDDAYTLNEDQNLIVLAPSMMANDTDIEVGTTLTVELVSNPSHGTLLLNAQGDFVYHPSSNWYGVDSFTYKVWDGVTYSNVATVSLTVNPVNDAPVANAGGPYTIHEGNSVTLEASASTDPENDIVSYEWDLDNDGQYDDASGSIVSFTYAAGAFTVAVKVTDTDGSFDTSSVKVIIRSNNIPGDANGDGRVDGSDVTILANYWQAGINDSRTVTWNMGDFNYDGQVDGSDVSILAGNWQAGINSTVVAVSSPEEEEETEPTEIPTEEPTSTPQFIPPTNASLGVATVQQRQSCPPRRLIPPMPEATTVLTKTASASKATSAMATDAALAELTWSESDYTTMAKDLIVVSAKKSTTARDKLFALDMNLYNDPN